MDPVTIKSFWLAFKILLSNFHAINRRYFATVINVIEEVRSGLEECKLRPEFIDDHKFIVSKSPCNEEYMTKILNNFNGSDLEGFLITLDILSKKVDESAIKVWAIAGKQLITK